MIRLLLTPFLSSRNAVADAAASALSMAVVVALLYRFGLLAFVVANVFTAVLGLFPFSMAFGSWYGRPSAYVLLGLASLVIYAFRVALAGRTLPGGAVAGQD
jgi:hypothetical protein